MIFRHAALAAVLLLGAAALGNAQSADVSGDWEITITSPQGSRTMKVTLKQTGDLVKGAVQTQGGELVLDGTVKGGELKLAFTVPFQGNPLLITLTAPADGTALKGAADFGGFAQGDWSARRASASAAAAPSAAATAATGDFSGDWDVTMNSPTGTFNFQANVKQSGEKVSGFVKSAQGQVQIEGAVAGNQLKFSYTVPFQGNPLLITMSGKREGDGLKGDADFGGFAQGDWSAKRAAAGSAAAAAPAAAGSVDVTGAWVFQVETSAGSGSPSFTFKQDGEKLTGQYKGLLGEATLTGTVKGNAITFSFKVNVQGNDATVTYTGTVDKDSMKGTAALGDLGSATFTAKRQ